MPHELFRQGDHACLMFSNLGDEGGEAVQANQFLIVDGDQGAIIDPGGNLAGGMRLTVGRRELIALPAHFMHAEGNFQFYDPTARILFSGDLGVSLVSGEEALKPIASLSPLPRGMEGFHRRYMVSNKVLRCWARMVRELDIDMIVPQHGSPLVGDAVPQFIAWAEGLSCGIDLMNDTHYRVPA